MTIRQQQRSRSAVLCRCPIVATLFLFVSGFAASLYILLMPSYVVVDLSNIHKNILFTSNKVYHLNGVAYDFYSVDELQNRSEPRSQWKTFPLPNEHLPENIIPWMPNRHQRKEATSIEIFTPSETTTGLAFVDHIYIASAPNLTDRHANLKKSFAQYQITNYEWRMKWTRDICNAPDNKEEVYRKLNLDIKIPIGSQKDQGRCAITVEHVDIWHDIVTRNSSLSLILEDDAVFVSHFREKFERTIYTAIRTGALKIGGLTHCIKDKPRLSNNSNEWYEQDPMIVIGGCIQIHDHNFEKNRRNVPPMLSTHKAEVTRCTHAYLLTACSAQALLRQITAQKNKFLPIDHMLNELAAASPTVQSFWLDPPIVYQGNQINDFDGIPSFAKTTYWSK